MHNGVVTWSDQSKVTSSVTRSGMFYYQKRDIKGRNINIINLKDSKQAAEVNQVSVQELENYKETSANTFPSLPRKNKMDPISNILKRVIQYVLSVPWREIRRLSLKANADLSPGLASGGEEEQKEG